MHHARLGALCGSATCAWKHQTTPASYRCAVCQCILLPEQVARGACAKATCQREWLVDRPLRERRARRRMLVEHAAAFRDSCANANANASVADADTYEAIPIPYNRLGTMPLPDARRDAFRAHLTRKLSEALERIRDGATERTPPALRRFPNPSPSMSAVLQVACGTCRGKCCSNGGEHAYITVDTMLGYFEQHPHETLDEVVERYMGLLPDETMEVGCVYQHAKGCSLPRAMRSETCNTFFCESLVELQLNRDPDAPVRAFFAPEEEGFFVQGVFASQELVTIVNRRSPIGQPISTP